MLTCFCGKECTNPRGLARHQSGCERLKLHRAELSENRRARAAASQSSREAKQQKVTVGIRNQIQLTLD